MKISTMEFESPILKFIGEEEMVISYVNKTPKSKQISCDEKEEVVRKIELADKHRGVISVIDAVSYWN